MSHPLVRLERWLRLQATWLHDLAGRPFQWLILKSPLHRWLQATDPNSWSLLRLPLSFLIALALRAGRDEIAVTIFLIALLTDRLDGELARMTGRTSSLGEQIDTFVDGAMSAAICLGLGERLGHVVLPGLVIPIAPTLVALEAGRLGGGFLLRSWSQTAAERLALLPNLSGKYKMALFGLSVFMLLLGFPPLARDLALVTLVVSLYSLLRHIVDWSIARAQRPSKSR